MYLLYIQSLEDIRSIAVSVTEDGTPIRLADIANIHYGPDLRRGLAELNGEGEVAGGIVVMRYGDNALSTINNVKEKLKELEKSLPAGVKILPVYDRSDLIHRGVNNLKHKLLEESLIVSLICIIFLFHARSALVAIVTLPIGILMLKRNSTDLPICQC